MFGSRILILAAHPDDEVVACAAAALRARKEGAQVFVLYLTNGCIARETLWPWQRKHTERNVARRRAEAEKVAALLELGPAGFSDLPARHLWRNAPRIYKEINRALATHGIDQIWAPAYEGGNADHDALNGIVARLPLRHQENGILEFAEYNFAGGRKNSHAFPAPNGNETILLLTAEEQKKKRMLLDLYASEKGNLDYVETRRETFRPLPAYDYSTPPHQGTLWYGRFGWVPFPHPRVDRTKPEQVCHAITTFL